MRPGRGKRDNEGVALAEAEETLGPSELNLSSSALIMTCPSYSVY